MKKLKLLLFACFITLFSFQSAYAKEQVDPKFIDDIRALIKLTGADEIGYELMSSVVGQFKEALPEVPDGIWDDLLADKQSLVDAMNQITIDVYVKHLTHEDIKGLIAFYSSPLGEKLIRTLPAINQENLRLGQKWGHEYAKRIQAQLERAGYLNAI